METVADEFRERGLPEPLFHVFSETLSPCPSTVTGQFDEFPTWPVELDRVRTPRSLRKSCSRVSWCQLCMGNKRETAVCLGPVQLALHVHQCFVLSYVLFVRGVCRVLGSRLQVLYLPSASCKAGPMIFTTDGGWSARKKVLSNEISTPR